MEHLETMESTVDQDHQDQRENLEIQDHQDEDFLGSKEEMDQEDKRDETETGEKKVQVDRVVFLGTTSMEFLEYLGYRDQKEQRVEVALVDCQE